MKSLIATLSLILILTSILTLHAQDKKPLYTITKSVVDVKFTTAYTIKDIAQVKEDLKKENIDINYSLLQFDEKGFLQKISASLNFNNGTSGDLTSGVLKPEDGPSIHKEFNKIEISGSGRKQ